MITRRQHPSGEHDINEHAGFTLVYLLFAYIPLFFGVPQPERALLATVIATAAFLPLHFSFYRRSAERNPLPYILAVACLGWALAPYSFGGGNTFLIYAMAMSAASLRTRAAIGLGVALVLVSTLVLAAVVPNLRFALAAAAVCALIGGVVMAGILYSRAHARRSAELRLTQDEVRRLAGMAERERIGRDLHDLLGHTLSVVALKSELAGKLIERDPAAARLQIREVESVAREALAQVREAVAGIRATGLQAELASARLTLLAAGVRLDQNIAPFEASPAVEHALALALREAVTNIVRHAVAQRVDVELVHAPEQLRLSIVDDGRGGADVPGHGLVGMRERVAGVGGTLEIDSPRGGGTRLVLRVPHATAQVAA
jgi:two-component system sensor histidine kinase DesK